MRTGAVVFWISTQSAHVLGYCLLPMNQYVHFLIWMYHIYQSSSTVFVLFLFGQILYLILWLPAEISQILHHPFTIYPDGLILPWVWHVTIHLWIITFCLWLHLTELSKDFFVDLSWDFLPLFEHCSYFLILIAIFLNWCSHWIVSICPPFVNVCLFYVTAWYLLSFLSYLESKFGHKFCHVFQCTSSCMHLV